jgi:hypothetical protein
MIRNTHSKETPAAFRYRGPYASADQGGAVSGAGEH